MNVDNYDGSTPLTVATQGSHGKHIEILLRAGADVNFPDFTGLSALILAVTDKCEINCVSSFVAAGADVDARDNDGKTALTWSVHHEHAECIENLVQAGADVNLVNYDGSTPLTVAAQGSHDKHIEILLRAGADVNFPDFTGLSPLILAAIEKCNENCVANLVSAGADVNAQDSQGNTALTWAAQHEHAECIKMLAKAGACVNIQGTISGETPLMIALLGHNPTDCVEALIAAGADVNIANHSGDTPLSLAAKRGILICAERLLETGADVNFQDLSEEKLGNTALMWAAQEGNDVCADPLIQKGADVNGRNRRSVTALMLAGMGGKDKCVRLLLKAGASVKICDNEKQTALNKVVRNKHLGVEHLNCAKMLLAVGAKVCALGHVSCRNVRCDNMRTLLFAAGAPFCADVRADVDSPESELRLSHLCRDAVRRHLLPLSHKRNLFVRVPKLGLPVPLQEFLLYDISLDVPGLLSERKKNKRKKKT